MNYELLIMNYLKAVGGILTRFSSATKKKNISDRQARPQNYFTFVAG